MATQLIHAGSRICPVQPGPTVKMHLPREVPTALPVLQGLPWRKSILQTGGLCTRLGWALPLICTCRGGCSGDQGSHQLLNGSGPRSTPGAGSVYSQHECLTSSLWWHLDCHLQSPRPDGGVVKQVTLFLVGGELG